MVQGCARTGVREPTEILRVELGLSLTQDGLVCHTCRQPGLQARNEQRKLGQECAHCGVSVNSQAWKKARSLSLRDANILGIAENDSKPKVCGKCYSELQSELRRRRSAGLIAIAPPPRIIDVKKENASLRKRLRAAEAKAKGLEDTLARSAVLDGQCLGQSKAQRIWDVNASTSSSKRYAQFIVDQMGYMATPAAQKCTWSSRTPPKDQIICLDQPIKVRHCSSSI
jgi:hypothetical protein